MCGIYGMVALRGVLRTPERADRLAALVRARGPDHHGRHATPASIVGVHRLRVVDLTPDADQPFVHDGRALAVNGEIYNAVELRERFRAFPWRSRTDGEVLLPLLAGRDAAALRSVTGMFGLAHWDARARTLILARDAAGEKPLFWARHGDEIWFASRPDALADPPALDRDAAAEFLHLGVVRPPRTLFTGVRAVPAGTAVVFTPTETSAVRYRDFAGEADETASGVAQLAQAIDAAVGRQLTADVPVGLFLSGGLDSSLVARMASTRRPGLPAFCVGFPHASFDERPWARRVARELHLPLVEVEAGTDDLLRAHDLALDLGEPLADPAVLPTILLAERARQEVTVVLSGEGADELFGGYPTYPAHRLAGLPFLASCIPPVARLLPTRPHTRMPLAWLLRRFGEEAARPVIERHVAWFSGALPTAALTAPCPLPPAPGTHAVQVAMHLDRAVWLPERLLTKLDRATMRVGLEARAPFLDPTVARMANAAARGHVRPLAGKRLLRRVARGRVPSCIVRRGKRGMSVPVGALLTGPLGAEADRLLAADRLARDGLVHPAVVRGLLDEHRAGRADHGRALWTLFTFMAWRERNDT